jgi:ribonuclease Y
MLAVPRALRRYQKEQDALGTARVKLAEEEALVIIEDARTQASDLLRQAEHEAKEAEEEADQVNRRRRREMDKEEERLQKRREDLDKRFERIELRETTLNKRQSRMDKKENDLAKTEEIYTAELTRISQLTIEEARSEVLMLAEKDARNDMARIIRQVESEARESADERARAVISMAVQRLASEHVSEISVSVLQLPTDDMKGRIIGRNGRNIRSFELATGVDVVVDDTPEAITISSFDPSPP